MRLLGVDTDALQKQYKVPINSQMFIKSNPKGMALMVHTLLCLFDEQEFKPLFSVCWFPYTMVELKEFKALVLHLSSNILTSQGRLAGGILTKAVLETASGVKMWQVLRQLSDYCIMDSIVKTGGYSKADIKIVPEFVQSVL